MKYFAFLFWFFSLVSVSYSQEVKIEIKDGLYSIPLQNAMIILENQRQHTIDTIQLKDLTEFSFKMKKKESYTISVFHPSENYYSRRFTVQSPKSKIIVYLYPTKDFEDNFENKQAEKYAKSEDIDSTNRTGEIDSLEKHQKFTDLAHFVSKNVVFPFEELDWRNEKISVRVKVQLDGQITDVKIMRGSSSQLINAEIKRVIRSSPKWEVQEKVLYYSIPITVKVQ